LLQDVVLNKQALTRRPLHKDRPAHHSVSGTHITWYKVQQFPCISSRRSPRSTPKAIQTTHDVGYYTLGGPKLSKLCIPCTFDYRHPTYKLTTSEALGGRGGNTLTVLPRFQIAMYLDIVYISVHRKYMYLEKSKRIVIWDGGSIYKEEYTMVSNSKSFRGNYCLCKKAKGK
jgi:hypothetical protein